MPETSTRSSAADVSLFIRAATAGLWEHLVEDSTNEPDTDAAWAAMQMAEDLIATLERLKVRYPEEEGRIAAAKGLTTAVLLTLDAVVQTSQTGVGVEDAWSAAMWTASVLRGGFDPEEGGDDA